MVGDGAVGLLGVLAAKQLGAERIIAMSRHQPRQQLALEYGATDIVTERGDDGVQQVKDLTDGLGAHSVIEAVGTQESMMQAIRATRPGGHVGYVGVNHDVYAARRGTVLLPRPPARRARPGTPVPTGTDRPDLEQADRPGQSLRPHPASRAGRRRLPRHGRTPRHQNPAQLVTGPGMNPTYNFTGQVALVTGAGSGMGLVTAQAFAEAGAAVVLSDINQAAVTAAVDALTASGHQAIAVACDVADESHVAAMTARTVATFGRLDMAFNNAGIQVPPSDAADEPAENFDRVTAINLRGVWTCMKHELHQMRDQGSGAIVNCSSLGGLVGLPGRAAYHASKHGVIGLTKSAALEYAPRNIRINAICPGAIDTPMVAAMTTEPDAMANMVKTQPIGRLGRADEIAAAVLWLASPAASLVTGVALPVDGGYTAE